MSEVQTLAAKAADVIEQRGWTQGGYASCDGSVCLLGAVRVAASGDPYGSLHLAVPLWNHLNDRTDGNCIAWNDDLGRTKDEVVALLRSIAEGS